MTGPGGGGSGGANGAGTPLQDDDAPCGTPSP